MKMFEQKQYFISKFSLENRYCVDKEMDAISCYEKWFLTKDEYKNKYVILFERIGNSLPDLKELFFELPIHEAIIYPLDLIEKSNVYIFENEIGFVYSPRIMDYQMFAQAMQTDKKNKVKLLRLLCNTIADIHKKKIYLTGFDKRQLMVEGGKIKIRYNGFKNHNRNSVHRVPDYFAEKFSSAPWILDAFSLVAIIFEYMYQWKPFCGMMTSFSRDEEYQFEVFYNNFRKKIFIFEREKKMNQIGFLVEQRPVIEKWNLTDLPISRFIENILTLNIPTNYSEDTILLEIQKLITYYENSELFQ